MTEEEAETVVDMIKVNRTIIVIGVGHGLMSCARMIHSRIDRLETEERRELLGTVMLINTEQDFPLLQQRAIDLRTDLLEPIKLSNYNPKLPEESMSPEKFYLTKHKRGQRKHP